MVAPCVQCVTDGAPTSVVFLAFYKVNFFANNTKPAPAGFFLTGRRPK